MSNLTLCLMVLKNLCLLKEWQMLKLSKMLNFLLLTWQNIVRVNQKLNLLTTTNLSTATATLLMQTTTATLTKATTTATAKVMKAKMVMISLKTNQTSLTNLAMMLMKMAKATQCSAILILATNGMRVLILMHQAILFLSLKLMLLGLMLKVI